MSKVAGVFGFVVWGDNKAFVLWSLRGVFHTDPLWLCPIKRICWAGRFQFLLSPDK